MNGTNSHWIEITPLRGPFRKTVQVPGSKSLAARAAIAACLSDGVTELAGDASAEDIGILLGGLTVLGADVTAAPGRITISAGLSGGGRRIPPRPSVDVKDVNAGFSGTAARFLLALASAGGGAVRLDGGARLRDRPMAPLVSALRSIGGPGFVLTEEGAAGRLPLLVRGSGLLGGACDLDAGESSQFVSALLLSGSAAREPVEITLTGEPVSRPYIALTLEVARAFGLRIEQAGQAGFKVFPGRGRGRVFEIEPDAASAGYAFVAAAITGGEVTIPGLPRGSSQPEMALVPILERMGCEASGGLVLRGPALGALRAVDADLRDAPDSFPALAAAALFADGPSRLRGAAHLRLKESDRLAALAEEFGRIGARIEEHEDGLTIHPGPLHGARVSSHGDHRIAMCLGVIGLRVGLPADPGPGGRIRLDGSECVAKSFPDFWRQVIC